MTGGTPGTTQNGGAISITTGRGGSTSGSSGALTFGTGTVTSGSFGTISLKQGSNTRLFVDANGNVGIGTSTPGSHVLNVNGNTNITGTLTTSGTINGASISGGTLSAGSFTGGAVSGGTLSGGTYADTGLTATGNYEAQIGNTNTFSITDGTNTLLSVADAGSVGNLSNIGTITTTGAINGLSLTANAIGFSIVGGTTTPKTLTLTDNASLNQSLLTTSSPIFAGLTLNDASFQGNNQVLYGAPSTGALTGVTATSTSGQCLLSGTTTPAWGACPGGSVTNLWQENAGVVSPKNITDDLTIGGISTASAKFQVFADSGNVTTDGTLTVSGTGNSSIAGNVGIGTSSPGSPLHILYANSTATNPALQLESSGSQTGISFRVSSGVRGVINSDDNGIHIQASNSKTVYIGGSNLGTIGPINFQEGKAAFDASGNLGIGTTSP
jgi:hypothetical protein